LLASCAVGAPAPERSRFRDPEVTPVDPPDPPELSVPPAVHPDRRDESTGDILPDGPPLDAGTDASADAGHSSSELDGAPASTLLAADAALDATEANVAKRCQRGSRSLSEITVPAGAGYTLLMDDRFIYYQKELPQESSQLFRQDLVALPRAVLYDPTLPVTPLVILNDDFAIDSIVSDGSNYLYFIAMPQANRSNQGLFSVQKRERAAFESLPIHALATDDSWPGQLAVDDTYFYLASIGTSTRSLRIVRIARTGYQREELWLNMSAGNDDSAIDAMTLLQGDIALDRDNVYFTARINHERGPHTFRVYRLSKQGRHQTPVLITTIENTYGGLASDGTHLFFSDKSNLVQWDLATGASEILTAQEGMIDLSYLDGVLSWTPSSTRGTQLDFFCL
jgi:hypothetical protein